MTEEYKKKLIEVALPLEAINQASAREKSIRHGHPGTLHLWWARRPLAAARAMIFAQMVDDPSAHPDLFPSEKAQEKERKRLFKLIEDLVQWENTTDEDILGRARNEIWQSWRRTCAENADHPQARTLFDRHKLPVFHDPFAGGGALPLEAQRLGLESYASDLNPVAVLINKAMIEIPSQFAGRPPVNPDSALKPELLEREWPAAQGLAADVLYYGHWMAVEAEHRIGHLYPKIEITAEMVSERPDLKPYGGQLLTVIALIWARTVRSPNPAFADIHVPLVASFALSSKSGREVWIDPVVRTDGTGYDFVVRMGGSMRVEETVNKRGAVCLMSGTPMPFDHIRSEAQAGRMGTRLMAMVADGNGTRIYLSPTEEMEVRATEAVPQNAPETELPEKALGLRVQKYGMTRWRDLFTARQLVTLTAFADLVTDAREMVERDAIARGLARNEPNLDSGGKGAAAYADAVAMYLGLTASKATRFITTLSTWRPDETKLSRAFTRNDIAMTWDFAETNPFSGTGGDLDGLVEGTASVLNIVPASPRGVAYAADACGTVESADGRVLCTDPPYYDNVPYADLSDYFYVWLRHCLRPLFPSLFATVTVPKAQELVADSIRHGTKAKAEMFFMEGMTRAMQNLRKEAHPAFPITVYYAFKQAEIKGDHSISTGWETFLGAAIEAGFTISGTWPVRTEGKTRMRSFGSNALATSIVLVCRPRAANAPIGTRRDFLSKLKTELPTALARLQRGNIAPVDLAQAAIGPGMAVYTRYAKVLDAEGEPLSVRQALTMINEILDEVLAEQEGDFDTDTRWALSWFEQFGFTEAEYGVAETLSKAKNTSVSGMVDGGILASKGGKVRLLPPEELRADWNPDTDARLTVWEMVHHLIRMLVQGEAAAAGLVAKLGARAEVARELAYRLFALCEKKKRANEALAYNALVLSWPEIIRLARQTPVAAQTGLFEES